VIPVGLEEFSTDSVPGRVISDSVLPALKEYAKEHSDQKWLNSKRLAKELPYIHRKITYYLQRDQRGCSGLDRC
jgi:hypothetical protein